MLRNHMRLLSLYLYPVKSARGLALSEGVVGERGLEGDRRFMVIDEAGLFLTQRTLSRMALLQVTLSAERLRLFGPGVDLDLPRHPSGGERRRVTVWRDQVDAWSLGPQPELSAFLERRVELVYMPDETVRPVDLDWAPPGKKVGFADGFPFLLTTTASLAELARRGADVEMIRFRPNLVIDGTEPFAEDGWRALRIGAVRFLVCKPCARCTIPNVDPLTGEVGVEPTRTLIGFRKFDGKVRFGQNLVAEDRGLIRVGDEVVIEA